MQIPERIAAGTTNVNDLAKEAECDVVGLTRMLRHLVGKGVFTEASPGEFALNDTARELLDRSRSLILNLDGIGDRYARIWDGLLTAVRTGHSVYHKIFRLPFWKDLAEHPGIAASYEELIAGHDDYIPSMNFDIEGGWESVRSVIFLGGETGARLAELMRAHPQIHGTLLELPRAIEQSKQLRIFENAGVADRVTWLAQSYFDQVPAGADIYLMHGALRAWPDALAIRLLTRCAEAARPDGRVVILDDVSTDLEYSSDKAREKLLELMIAGKGMRTRSVPHFTQLAERAGLVVTSARQLSEQPFVVECRTAPAPAYVP